MQHTILARAGDGHPGWRLLVSQAGYSWASCVYYFERNADELMTHLRGLPSVRSVEKIAVGEWPTSRKRTRLPPAPHKDCRQ